MFKLYCFEVNEYYANTSPKLYHLFGHHLNYTIYLVFELSGMVKSMTHGIKVTVHAVIFIHKLLVFEVRNILTIFTNLITNGTIGKEIGANGKAIGTNGTNVTNQWYHCIQPMVSLYWENPKHTQNLS